ncbi:MAG: pyruvate formate lyase family protein [Eubacteriales bacterium]|nr:pyruvate formate lyase family protein [Eubacteriales bacterium]
MIELNERCMRLREEAVNIKSASKKTGAQRDMWFRYGERNLPQHLRSNITLVAAGIAATAENAAPYIAGGELIVGYNFGDGEYGGLTGDPARDREIFAANGFSDGMIDGYYADCPPLYTHTPIDEGFSPALSALVREGAVCNSAGRSSITCNHSVLGYEKVLKLGFEGLSDEVGLHARGGDSLFYVAERIVCRGGMKIGERYAAHALALAESADRERRDELKEIARICQRVPRYPASNFREALQSLWFAHILNTWEDGINANSLGRLDKILYPYYKKDIESGALSREEAFELICCLWIKLYRDYDVQQCCIGGSRRLSGGERVSEVNDLSRLMLDATEACAFVRCMSVRVSSVTERSFVRRALEVVGRVGMGVPFFFNDDVMIPALELYGIAPEDADDYCAIGCVETLVPGKTNPHAVNTRVNLLKAAEYALGNGRSMFNPGLPVAPETGDPLAFERYGDFRNAVFTQIDYLLESAVSVALAYMDSSEKDRPKPYKSLLTEGCVARGVDFNARGALYDYYQLMFLGIPNLADSMAAIKTLVYDEKRYSMAELLYQLENNFPDEAVRLDFLRRAPKFGNDEDLPDSIAAEILNYACDRTREISEQCGYSFHPQPFSFLWMLEHGAASAASADGRRRGEILAYSASPMQGRDESGLTALLNSLSRLPTKKTPGTTSAIVEIEPKLFEDGHLDILCDIFMAASTRGLCNVQFNTVNASTMLDAQLHPENHRNLAVRVSGFSQKFNLLSRELQDHIIARTKHAKV